MVSRISAPTDRGLLLALAAALLAGGALQAADFPTKDEWDPVRAAIDADQPDAEQRLSALVAHFPQWADGQRELAKQRLRHSEIADALASAEQALKLDASQAEAACVQVQALGVLGRAADAYAAVDAFSGKDKGGWLHYFGSKVALESKEKDLPRAERLLKSAHDAAGGPVPPEFAFLEARIDRAKGDRDGARLALQQATQANERFYDGWYELGRVELELAGDHPEQAKGLVEDANTHFERSLKGRPEDANSLYGVGYARYERAKLLLQAHDENSGREGLRDAVAVLDQAVGRKPDFALAHYVLGNVLVQLGSFAEAIPHLRRAEELGLTDRAAQYNLALALQRTGDRAGADAILAKNQAVTPSEQIQVGMNAYHEHDFGLAAQLLASVAPKLDGDAERQGAVYRFLGHALREQAADLPEAESARREELLEAAATAYASAGALKDRKAQDFFLAIQTSRSADLGYAAAWRYLGWKTWLSPTGWMAVIGNYGGYLTGGRGIGGAWERHPIHVSVWGALLALPLVMVVVSLLRRQPAPEPASRRAPSDAGRPKPTSPERPRPAPRQAPTERSSPRAHGERASGERTPTGGARIVASRTPPSELRTTPASAQGAAKPAKDRQKAETEEISTPPHGSATTPGPERKTPPRRR